MLETRDTGALVTRRRVCGCGARWTTEEKLRRASLTPTGSLELPLPLGVETTTGRGSGPLGCILSDPGSSLDLGSSGSPDPSKPTQEMVNTRATRPLPVVVPSPVTVVLRLFCEAWKGHYGASYVPSPAECRQLRGVASRLPLEALPVILERYLADEHPFVAQEMRHSLRFFLSRELWNKYRVVAPVRSAKEARGREAVRQFVNGEPDAGPRR